MSLSCNSMKHEDIRRIFCLRRYCASPLWDSRWTRWTCWIVMQRPFRPFVSAAWSSATREFLCPEALSDRCLPNFVSLTAYRPYPSKVTLGSWPGKWRDLPFLRHPLRRDDSNPSLLSSSRGPSLAMSLVAHHCTLLGLGSSWLLQDTVLLCWAGASS